MKKKNIIILIIVIIILIVGIIGGYFIYKNIKGRTKTAETNWGNAYYEQIICIQDKLDIISDESKDEDTKNSEDYYEGIAELATDINVEFFDIDNDNIPEMIATYDNLKHENYSKSTIYKYDENTGLVTFYVTKGVIELLYNIETQEYGYYVKTGSVTGTLQYTPVNDTIQGNYSNAYAFTNSKGEITSNLDVADGEIPTISKLDETFITIGELNEEQLLITETLTQDEIKQFVNKNVKNAKNISQTITDEVKNETDSKLQELQANKDKIQQLEEKATAENTEEKATEEETEQTQNKISAGNYTLDYATYSPGYSDGQYGFTLKANGQAHFTTICPDENIDTDGTYSYANGVLTFTASNGITKSFNVTGNNQLEANWEYGGTWKIRSNDELAQ